MLPKLPEDFLSDMNDILKDEFDDFIKSYSQQKTTGLRINTLKVSKEKYIDINPFSLTQIEWCSEGFYYDETINRPGKHPYHSAGVYYLQEPSAMSVVPKLDIKPFDKVLDMCAAPGGKSTYIAAKLEGKGLLVSNEIDGKRVKALGENLERFGVSNVIITNTSADNLEKDFTDYFNKILIDAPCSGEGMFRKDDFAIKDWSVKKVADCCAIQEGILENAYNMLKNDGTLVYSTCTFSREENEYQIEKFVQKHTDIKIESMERFWPHKIKGEGHFVAKLTKNGGLTYKKNNINVINAKLKIDKKLAANIKDFFNFQTDCLSKPIVTDDNLNRVQLRHDNIFLLPEICPEIRFSKVLRKGLYLGQLKKNRFEPSHALSHFLKCEDVKHYISFGRESIEIANYLKGDTIKSSDTKNDRGWVLVCVDNFPLGWAKEAKGVMKNHYPKGLRA